MMLKMPAGFSPFQIEIPEKFPDNMHKGRKIVRANGSDGKPKKGSVHLRPATMHELSDDEAEFVLADLKASRPALAARVQTVATVKTAVRAKDKDENEKTKGDEDEKAAPKKK